MSDSNPSETAGAIEPHLPPVKRCPQCDAEYEAGTDFCPKDGSTLVVPGATGLDGQIIAGRYRILRQIGEGGMGRVYLAEHVKMGRRCAFKVLAQSLVSDAEAIGRFNREAMNASRILHPNVAAVYDFGEADDGLVYLAMELVDGEPLSAICAREKVIPPERAIDIACQVAEGLIPAHELGIVHRDLKPDNIIVGTAKDGRDIVKIIDFGIAKGMEGDKQRVTRTGFIVGTPEYMSPEQLAGDTLDGRSDLFALGCVLYRLLTGASTFAGTSMESQIQRRLTRPPPHVRATNPEVPQWVDAVVARAMEREPADRYQTAVELRDALRAGATSSTARRRALAIPAVSRRFWFAAGAAAGVTLLVSLGMRAENGAAPGHVATGQRTKDSVPVVNPTAIARPTPATGAHVGTTSARVQDSEPKPSAPVSAPAPRMADAHRENAVGARAGTAHSSDTTRAHAAESGTTAAPPVTLAASHATSVPVAPPATPSSSASVKAPAPQAPAPPSVDLSAVQTAITRYAHSLESRDIAQVRAVYPALTDEQARRWKDVFDATSKITATLTAMPPARLAAADTATVSVKAAFAFDYRRGVQGDPNPTATYHATLARTGNGWMLIAIE